MSETDHIHMDHALRLAARGNGLCWPNPSVGCVLVRDGIVVGRGTTQKGGRPHAERVALAQAGEAAHGATAYVTLEPCAHTGKTTPCAEALVAAGITRVVSALTDPDPRVSGGGHAILRAAGIAVTEGIRQTEAARITAGFLKRVTQNLPLLTLKLATTLDGRIATQTGESRWLTGADARRSVHAMRMEHDAVLVGAGTARADDPDLRVRDLGSSHQPLRLVIDSTLSHRPDSRLGQSAHETPVWLLHGPKAPEQARQAWQATGARLIPCPVTAGGQIDLRAALTILASEGLTRVFCEGGGTLAASLIRSGLVDRLALFSAGCLIGAEGQPALGPLALPKLADAPRPTLIDQRRIGADLLSLWDL